MEKITTKKLKDLFIKFYTQKGHAQVASASLVPENDASVLFTTAGMQPLVPYLLGETHPAGTRLVDYQACIRTNDIDSVGDDSHLTFFEMLGRWSLGDYDKVQAIQMSFEFLTSKEYLNIPIHKLAVSVFAGDENAPRDEVAFQTWLDCGMPKEQIFFLPAENNWWKLGEVGPCGPDSEMFFVTDVVCDNPEHCNPGCDCGKYLEIGNDVFMSFYKDETGKLTELKNKNIDTGMGLERNALVFNGYSSVYETDAFRPAIAQIEQLSDKKYGESDKITKAIRIIADHIRTSTMILGDTTTTKPSNVGRGYVLRRLLRRSVRYALELEFAELKDLAQIAKIYIDQLGEYYPSLVQQQNFIVKEIKKEIAKFQSTITAGLKEAEKVMSKLQGNVLDGKTAFRLYDTFGFPIELTQEYMNEHGIKVDMKGYEQAFAKHQELSRGNSAQTFKSGLAGTGGVYNRYHTATHLLHAVLRKKFGESVHQAGSAITEDKMRFDFTFDRKLTPEEVAEVQDQVNDLIAQDLPVTRLELSKQEARNIGAFGIFDDKYGDVVSVYTIGTKGAEVSKEFCTGPHVDHTGEIGEFVITKEQSSSAGVRRIKAIVK